MSLAKFLEKLAAESPHELPKVKQLYKHVLGQYKLGKEIHQLDGMAGLNYRSDYSHNWLREPEMAKHREYSNHLWGQLHPDTSDALFQTRYQYPNDADWEQDLKKHFGGEQ